MIHRRILYLITLAAVLVFQIMNESYLALLLLALCIALPILSLLLSLTAMRGCRLILSSKRSEIPRGGESHWTLSAKNRSGLPVPRLTVHLETKNLFTGAFMRKKVSLNGVTKHTPIPFQADTAHCGLLELKVTRLRVYDYLGLFSVRRPLPETVRILVEPLPVDPGPLNLPEGQGQRKPSSPTSPKGHSEDYDLREYRPGDPMRSVHWKLSSKWDELIVKEGIDQLMPLPLLTLDHFGTAEEFDHALDRLMGFCHALLAVQRPHAVLWLRRNEPCLHVISSEKELKDCLIALCSEPLPATGTSILDHPELIRGPDGPVFHIHVRGHEEVDA